MYAATGGVNTHKGSIFSLGLLSAAAGALIGSDSRGDSPDSFGDAVCIAASRIASGIVSSELGREAEAAVGPTVGERLYLRHGVRGARGMAEDAFPLLRERMLPRLRMGRDSAVPTTQDSTGIRRSLWLDALLESMAVLDDTCVLGRGGLEGLRCIERGAREALDSGGAGTAAGASLIRELDVECCDRWLSPGGSADLVSAALFLDALERMPVRVF